MIEIARRLSSLADPSAVLCVVLLGNALAVTTNRRRLSLALQGVAMAIVVLLGVLPGSTWLALPLEERFPVDPPLPPTVAGIIALGGTERLVQSAAWGQPNLSDPSPVAALLALGRRYPEAKLVFSGGAAPRDAGPLTESQVVHDFLSEVGIAADRLIYEDRSRNTLENAEFTRLLLKPAPAEPWVLVTQAIAMPRAVAVFRHAGWNVIPYPAGFITDGDPSLSASLHLTSGLSVAAIAVHEWGGLLIYRIMGYTDEFFPR